VCSGDWFPPVNLGQIRNVATSPPHLLGSNRPNNRTTMRKGNKLCASKKENEREAVAIISDPISTI
jgi:hypothetical protein